MVNQLLFDLLSEREVMELGEEMLMLMLMLMLACVPTDKLLSLLPEYVVPYAIHLLAHDPDYIKVSDIEQLKDIKE